MLQKERHPNLDFFVADFTTWTRGLSSNGAENRVKSSSLLDRLAILLKKRHI